MNVLKNLQFIEEVFIKGWSERGRRLDLFKDTSLKVRNKETKWDMMKEGVAGWFAYLSYLQRSNLKAMIGGVLFSIYVVYKFIDRLLSMLFITILLPLIILTSPFKWSYPLHDRWYLKQKKKRKCKNDWSSWGNINKQQRK